MTKKFPIFASHQVASCFNCGADLDGTYWRDAGSAEGRYAQDCRKCNLTTWYDVGTEVTFEEAHKLMVAGRTLLMARESRDERGRAVYRYFLPAPP